MPGSEGKSPWESVVITHRGHGPVTRNRTARPRCLLRTPPTSSRSDRRFVPSGHSILTDGIGPLIVGGSVKFALNSNILAHFLGFFALTTFPVAKSKSAYARSPRSPLSVTMDALTSSPIIDFTGYRHKETTAPWPFWTSSMLTPPLICNLETHEKVC